MSTSTPSERAAALHDELFGEDLRAEEIAHILGLDETTVRRRLGDGTLQGYHLGREWRMTVEALRRYVATLKGNAMAGVSGTSSPLTPPYWSGGSSTIKFTPGLTHPIGSTITYSGTDADAEIDEP